MMGFEAETIDVAYSPPEGEAETVPVRVASLMDRDHTKRRGKLVLAIPGIGCTYNTYHHILRDSSYLGKDCSVVSLNLPGHGDGVDRTPRLQQSESTVENLAGLARAAMVKMRLDDFEYITIVGHSMAGPVALYLAGLVPRDRLMGLFPIEPNIVLSDCRTTAHIADQSEEDFVENGHAELTFTMANYTHPDDTEQTEARRWWARRFGKTDALSMHQASRSVVDLCKKGVLLELLLDRLHKIPTFCPYSADPSKGGAEKEKSLPQGVMERLAGSGHFLHMEQPTLVYEGMLRPFLDCAQDAQPSVVMTPFDVALDEVVQPNRGYSAKAWLKVFAEEREARMRAVRRRGER